MVGFILGALVGVFVGCVFGVVMVSLVSMNRSQEERQSPKQE